MRYIKPSASLVRTTKAFRSLPLDLKMLAVVFSLFGGVAIYGAILKLIVWRSSPRSLQLDEQAVRGYLVLSGFGDVLSDVIAQLLYAVPVFVAGLFIARRKMLGWVVWMMMAIYYILGYQYLAAADRHHMSVMRWGWSIVALWAIFRYRVFRGYEKDALSKCEG